MEYKLPTMKEVHESEARNLFTVVSTFAGAGGSSTGYRMAGGKILAVNEFIQSARDTYKANYPNTIIFPEDIRQLKGKDILEKIGLKEGELDIFDGSPPCASFSIVGNREQDWGKVKKYSETKQRTDDLFFEYSRLMNEMKPKVFIAENVKGLTLGGALNVLGTKQIDMFGAHKGTILDTLESCGYRVQYRILNAMDFGVPQNRQRLFIIGVRNDLMLEPSFPIPNILRYIYTVREGIEGIEDAKEDEDAEAYHRTHEVMKWIKMCKEGEPASNYHPKGNFFNAVRVDGYKPCNTVTQTLGGCVGLFHPFKDRLLSIPEIKRIMSFPDDFIVTGKFSQKWERMGRAVPPLLMKAIAENVYEEILQRIEEDDI